jgi:hypothetical protein
MPTGRPQFGAEVKLTADEKADREEATVWVSGLDKINAACGIGFCVDLSATPFYIQGSGYPEGSPVPVDRQRFLAGRCDRERHHQDSPPAGDGQHGPA